MRDFFAYLGLAFFPVSITLTALWLGARWRALRAEDVIRQIALQNGASITKTRSRSDMDAALDAVAIEVERIGEGQRFITKLLAERPPSSTRQSGSITPH